MGLDLSVLLTKKVQAIATIETRQPPDSKHVQIQKIQFPNQKFLQESSPYDEVTVTVTDILHHSSSRSDRIGHLFCPEITRRWRGIRTGPETELVYAPRGCDPSLSETLREWGDVKYGVSFDRRQQEPTAKSKEIPKHCSRVIQGFNTYAFITCSWRR